MAVSLGPVPIHRSLLAAVESAARITPPTRSTLPSATSLCGRCDSLRPWLGRFLRPSRRAVSTLPSSRAPTLLSRTPHRGPAGPVRISPVRTFLSSSPVIRDYVDLPPNYDDATGLPFRSRDLDEREVLGIFGPGISAASANRLLRILHGRRVAGTLDDPLVQVNTMPYTKQQQDAALAYLRARVPVDEVINAGLRAEDELRSLEKLVAGEEQAAEETTSNQQDAQAPAYKSRFRIYKQEEGKGGEEEEGEAEEIRRGRDAAARSREEIYGQSVLDKIRAKNEARWKEELRRKEEEKKKREEEEARKGGGPRQLQTRDAKPPRQVSPRMQKWMEAATSDLQAPPEMPAWERLLPSTLFVALLVAAAFFYAEFYRPPPRDGRLWPDVPPAAATVLALIGLNVAGFVLWRVPPLWRVMNRYFVLVAATPRPLSILGATFSHQKPSHLLTNMFFLWLFGTRLHDEVGRGGFLATYAAGGGVGFLATLYSLVLRRQLHVATLGASGAIYAVATAYFWLHRFDAFKILGLPPDPYNGIQGLGFIGLILALNLSALFSRSHMLDIASHLAGMGVGAVAGQLLEKKLARKRQQQQQRNTKSSDGALLQRVVEKQ